MHHARYLTFMPEARFHYARALGLWTNMDDFNAVGQIVAEASCTYRRRVKLGQTVTVAVRTAPLGNKSLEMAYELSVDGAVVATGRTVQVAYDYGSQRSIPVPAAWRELIAAFEGEALAA